MPENIDEAIGIVLLAFGQIDGKIEHALLEKVLELGLHVFLVEGEHLSLAAATRVKIKMNFILFRPALASL